MIVLLVTGYFIVSSYLDSYTDHGYKQSVPDFTGLGVDEAKELAETKDLRVEVIDTIYYEGAEPGEIVDHTPKPGFLVKKNRNIFLTINSFTPEEVEMPNLVNESLRDANAILESRGLKLGKITYEPYFARNLVLKQKYQGKKVKKGETLYKGTQIDLVLGSGRTDKKVALPHLVGLRYSAAVARLKEVSLNVTSDFSNNPQTAKDSANSFVFKQFPSYESGEEVMQGEEVLLFLTDTIIEEDPEMVPEEPMF